MFGQLLEYLHFGYAPNPSPLPDFPAADLELKTTGAIKRSSQWRAKERLVFSNISYRDIIREPSFAESSFLQKNAHILLVIYHWKRDVPAIDYHILGSGELIFSGLDERDQKIIEQDWQKIRAAVLAGRAHELSEGDTVYLKATRKGAGHGKDDRIQPRSNTPAPNRAFSFPASFMTRLIEPIIRSGRKKAPDSTALVEDRAILREKTFDELVLERFEPFVGRSVDAIMAELDPTMNRNAKGFFADLARRMLGVSTRRIEEFEKADIQMKTVRLRKSGMPKEDMSFPAFRYRNLVTQTWLDSDFRESLSKKFLFVFFRREGESFIFERALFWAMPETVLDIEVREVWEETVRRIRSGQVDNLPSKSSHHIAHVRPHARNAADTDEAPDGRWLIKKSFWLNSQYIAKIYRDTAKDH